MSALCHLKTRLNDLCEATLALQCFLLHNSIQCFPDQIIVPLSFKTLSGTYATTEIQSMILAFAEIDQINKRKQHI